MTERDRAAASDLVADRLAADRPRADRLAADRPRADRLAADRIAADRLASDRLAELPSLPVDSNGPVFAEPWQAQAFSLAVELSARGHFTWKEWATALAEEIAAAAARGERDDGSRYYEYWLAALERLVTARGLTERAALLERKEAWAEAYRRTPHGAPVELGRPPAA